MAGSLGRSKPWKEVDEVRAMILAEIIRKNYLEELQENNPTAKDKAEKFNNSRILTGRPPHGLQKTGKRAKIMARKTSETRRLQ